MCITFISIYVRVTNLIAFMNVFNFIIHCVNTRRVSRGAQGACPPPLNSLTRAWLTQAGDKIYRTN